MEKLCSIISILKGGELLYKRKGEDWGKREKGEGRGLLHYL